LGFLPDLEGSKVVASYSSFGLGLGRVFVKAPLSPAWSDSGAFLFSSSLCKTGNRGVLNSSSQTILGSEALTYYKIVLNPL
jgi:hypothetical protein